MQDNCLDFNYESTEHCDICDSDQLGTEMHANDAMGMATPVFWSCHRCANPPIAVKLYRETKRMILRGKVVTCYWLRTTKAQRAANTKRIADARAKIAARRGAS